MMKFGVIDIIKVNKYFFVDGNGLKLIGIFGIFVFFSFNIVIVVEGLNVC